MPRRKSRNVASQQEAVPLLYLAAHLPNDPDQLFTHCTAGWTAMKADQAHFPAPNPQPQVVDDTLLRLGKALKDAENGGTTEMTELGAAVKVMHDVWGQLVKYAQGQLRSVPAHEVPPILANILMYKSKIGNRPPKPPLDAQEGEASGTAWAIALAIAGALTYTYEWSVDQQSWSSKTIGQTRLLLTGLTPGKTYYLRMKALLRNGTTTDPIQIDFMVR